MAFELPALPYATNALEPNIDTRTMEIHHTKHHQAYVTNLNNAISGTDTEKLSIEEICKNIKLNIFASGTANKTKQYYKIIISYINETCKKIFYKKKLRQELL